VHFSDEFALEGVITKWVVGIPTLTPGGGSINTLLNTYLPYTTSLMFSSFLVVKYLKIISVTLDISGTPV
jgi:hypothetical protein